MDHESANTSLDCDDRLNFSVELDDWDTRAEESGRFHDIAVELVRDRGTGLALPLYQQAVLHLLGGETETLRRVEVVIDGVRHGEETLGMLDATTAFWLTA